MPFSDTIDLTENQNVSCELNTSNINVTGYKMTVSDSKNNVVFDGKNFTSLQDQTLNGYNNNGLNGSELVVPLVVTDPSNSNINNIYFSGYIWNHWKPKYKDILSNMSQISEKPSYEDATFGGYYYKSKKIKIDGYTDISLYSTINDVYRYNTSNSSFIELVEKPSYSSVTFGGYYYKNTNQSSIIIVDEFLPINGNISNDNYDNIQDVYVYDAQMGFYIKSIEKPSYSDATFGGYYYSVEYTSNEHINDNEEQNDNDNEEQNGFAVIPNLYPSTYLSYDKINGLLSENFYNNIDQIYVYNEYSGEYLAVGNSETISYKLATSGGYYYSIDNVYLSINGEDVNYTYYSESIAIVYKYEGDNVGDSAVYFYGYKYFRISEDVLYEYNKDNVYKKVGKVFRKVNSGIPDTIKGASNFGYYYRAGKENDYTKISKYKNIDHDIVLTNEDYDSLDNVYDKNHNYLQPENKYQSIEDNVYYLGYKKITTENTQYSTYNDLTIYKRQTEYNKIDYKPIDLDSALLEELYYNDYYVKSTLDIGSKLSYLRNYYLDQSGKMEIIDENISTSYIEETTKPSYADAISDGGYYYIKYHYTKIDKSISKTQYDSISEVYLHYSDKYSLCNPKPPYSLAIFTNQYVSFYYFISDFEYVRITSESVPTESDYANIQIVYTKESYRDAFDKIGVIYNKNVNHMIISQQNRPEYSEVINKYYFKRIYSFIADAPSYSNACDHNFYILRKNQDGNTASMVYVTAQNVTEDDYDNYITNYGVLYTFIKYQNQNDNVEYNNVYNYLEYVLAEDDVDMEAEYNNGASIFNLSYIYVGNLDNDFYVNNVYDLYETNNTYTEIQKQSKPKYEDAVMGQYYFLENGDLDSDYLPVTIEDCQYDSIKDYYVHDDNNYYVIDEEIQSWDLAYNDGAFYINYTKVNDIPLYIYDAIKRKYYVPDNSNPKNPYKLITSSMSQSMYYGYVQNGEIYTIDGLLEAPKNSDKNAPYFYVPIINFYNGYAYQPYNWRITLQQGDVVSSLDDASQINKKWFDMNVTSGTVIGSTINRLQGILSDNIYKDYFVQLCKNIYDVDSGLGYIKLDTKPSYFEAISMGYYYFDTGLSLYKKIVNGDPTETIYENDIDSVYSGFAASDSFVGNGVRVRVSSYDRSFGYIYPQDGYLSTSDIEEASYFQVYKYTNDQSDISPGRIVTFATTTNINSIVYYKKDDQETEREIKIEVPFKKENANSKYYIQIYKGDVGLIVTDIFSNKFDAGITEEKSINPMSDVILIKNQGNGDPPKDTLNGIYWLVDVTSEKVTDDNGDTYYLSTIRYQRTTDGDSLTDFINNAFYVSTGTYGGQNLEAIAKIGGLIDASEIGFIPEKPIMIYPNPGEAYRKYYPDISTYDYTSSGGYLTPMQYFSPLFKNSNTRTFIRPFVGIYDGMMFQYGSSLDDYFIIKYVDSYETDRTGLWYIDHDSIPYGGVFKPNELDYTIRTYFKKSDTNTFYAYKKPYISIYFKNWTEMFDEYGNYVISNRYILSDAVYKQEQNKSWKYYTWEIYNNTQDLDMGSTDQKFSGSFEHKFTGIENENQYSIYLYVEDELGFTQRVNKNAVVNIDIFSGGVDITAAMNCQTQSINFDSYRSSIIFPTPFGDDNIQYGGENYEFDEGEDISDKNSYMNLISREYEREYDGSETVSVVKYDKMIVNGVGDSEDITPPKSGNITSASEHILGEFFSGNIISVSSPINDSDISFTISAFLSHDVLKDLNGELYVNPNRNTMDCIVEFFNPTSENPIKKNSAKFIVIKNSGGSTSIFYDGKIYDVFPPVFAMGRQGEIITQNVDYLYTTYAYDGFTIAKFGSKTLYNLANPLYNNLAPESDNNVANIYYYNSDSQYNEWRGGLVNYCPLNSSPFIDNNDAHFGVWYDELLTGHRQQNERYILVTTREDSFWFDEIDGNPLYWQDNDSKYGFFPQVNLNKDENHSGKQVLSNYIMTINMELLNYNKFDVNAATQISQNYVFLNEISDN